MLRRVLIAQVGILVLVLPGIFVWSPEEARPVLLGAGVSLVGNAYSAWRVFSRPLRQDGGVELSSLHRAEIGKLAIVAALCGVVFAVPGDVSIAGFLLGLCSGMFAATTAAVTKKLQAPKDQEIHN